MEHLLKTWTVQCIDPTLPTYSRYLKHGEMNSTTHGRPSLPAWWMQRHPPGHCRSQCGYLQMEAQKMSASASRQMAVLKQRCWHYLTSILSEIIQWLPQASMITLRIETCSTKAVAWSEPIYLCSPQPPHARPLLEQIQATLGSLSDMQFSQGTEHGACKWRWSATHSQKAAFVSCTRSIQSSMTNCLAGYFIQRHNLKDKH